MGNSGQYPKVLRYLIIIWRSKLKNCSYQTCLSFKKFKADCREKPAFMFLWRLRLLVLIYEIIKTAPFHSRFDLKDVFMQNTWNVWKKSFNFKVNWEKVNFTLQYSPWARTWGSRLKKSSSGEKLEWMRLRGYPYPNNYYEGVNVMKRPYEHMGQIIKYCLWWTEACETAEWVSVSVCVCECVCVCVCVSAFQGALWAAIRGQQEAHHCRRKENPSSGTGGREAGETAVGGGRSAGRFMRWEGGRFWRGRSRFGQVSWPRLVGMQICDNATGGSMCKPLQINSTTKRNLLIFDLVTAWEHNSLGYWDNSCEYIQECICRSISTDQGVARVTCSVTNTLTGDPAQCLELDWSITLFTSSQLPQMLLGFNTRPHGKPLWLCSVFSIWSMVSLLAEK